MAGTLQLNNAPIAVGFFVESRIFVTASHCLPGKLNKDPNFVVHVRDNVKLDVEKAMEDPQLDLAVFTPRIEDSEIKVRRPKRRSVRRGIDWYGPERNPPGATLSGRVDDIGKDLALLNPAQPQDGEIPRVRVVQLGESHPEVTEYGGYSGGPAELHDQRSRRAPFAMIVRQARQSDFDSRISRENDRAVNVLFGLSIFDILAGIERIKPDLLPASARSVIQQANSAGRKKEVLYPVASPPERGV